MGIEYRIGAFADLAGVPAKTLRFYDEIGLLRPARVDPRTRYRFYRPNQLRELAAIVELKSTGVSLTEIRRLSKTAEPGTCWRRILHDLKRATERTIARQTQTLEWVNSLLEQNELQDRPTPVVIKQRRSVAIASVRAEADTYDDIARLEKELLSSLPMLAVGTLRGILWHRCGDSGLVEGEPFVALRQRVPQRASYTLGQLPAATLACAYSTMDEDSSQNAYRTLSRWTQVQGYRLVGPKREITHDQVLEIQFPVAPV
jgi:DNA-binding transcriptional MerR regulator